MAGAGGRGIAVGVVATALAGLATAPPATAQLDPCDDVVIDLPDQVDLDAVGAEVGALDERATVRVRVFVVSSVAFASARVDLLETKPADVDRLEQAMNGIEAGVRVTHRRLSDVPARRQRLCTQRHEMVSSPVLSAGGWRPTVANCWRSTVCTLRPPGRTSDRHSDRASILLDAVGSRLAPQLLGPGRLLADQLSAFIAAHTQISNPTSTMP